MLNSLTGLRFIAAFSIVFAHLTVPLQFNVGGLAIYPSLTSIIGMPLFFVLSGFVIHYNYADLFLKNPQLSATYRFGVARFSRIFPLYFAVLAFFLWHDDMLLHVWRKSPDLVSVATSFALGTFSWYPVWIDGKLLVQHGFGIAWSISTEWFFYVSYIFFARYLAASSVAACVKLLVLVVVAGFVLQFAGLSLSSGASGEAWLNSFYRWAFYISPYSRIFEFLLGCCVAQAVKSTDLSFWPNKKMSAFLIKAGFIVMALMVIGYAWLFTCYPGWYKPETPFFIRYIAHLHMNFGFAPLFGALILLLAVRDLRGDSAGTLLTCKPFVLLGEASYSLYLVHIISLRIVPIAQDYPNLWFRLLCGIAITFALAIGTYTMIEVPARRWLRKVLRG